jgi:hypothetical protein
MLSSSFLEKWRRKALRNGVLYNALDKEERGYLCLAIKTVDNIVSVPVGKILLGILCKLREALKSSFQKYMESKGVEKARVVSNQGARFGNESANFWKYSMEFVKYLTLIHYYSPYGPGCA